jgi:putative sigma-54 modulation protein
MELTDALRDYAVKKVEGIHLDYPKIIEAKFILDVRDYEHIAEAILFCTNDTTLEATAENENMYAAIDEAVSKVTRQMRKAKTKAMKTHRPHGNESIRTMNSE